MRAGEFLVNGLSGPGEEVFAEDFTFHYFNDRLPDLEGDYDGVDGMREFFSRLHDLSGGTFGVDPISLTPVGDELVVAHAENTLSVGGAELEFDALMLWRVYDGQIHEAWDIPAVHTSRTPATTPTERPSGHDS